MAARLLSTSAFLQGAVAGNCQVAVCFWLTCSPFSGVPRLHGPLQCCVLLPVLPAWREMPPLLRAIGAPGGA